jgi:hypothetical protein
METIPLDRLCLLDLEGRPTNLKEQTWNLLLLIFLRHLA